jgi:hypothetical protein
MPFLERDPWRMQYFEGVDCPDDVPIPTDDGDCYLLYPRYRWLYNKLAIAESQDLPAGPHGIEPPGFPIFSKPIYNMKGMGAGSRLLRTAKEYERYSSPGHMWMALLEGDHVSSDAAIVRGAPAWWRHTVGRPLDEGMFDYWTVLAEARPEIEGYCGAWIGRHLKDYTGIVNFETIGGKIIEAHLRLSDQWPDLYGRHWCDSVVALYRDDKWTFDDSPRRVGYSVVLFGAHGLRYRHPAPEVIERHLAKPAISSIQITFHEDKPPEAHSMPPGGFRLAIVNCTDLEAGMEVRERLALHFWSTQQLRRRPRRAAS